MGMFSTIPILPLSPKKTIKRDFSVFSSTLHLLPNILKPVVKIPMCCPVFFFSFKHITVDCVGMARW